MLKRSIIAILAIAVIVVIGVAAYGGGNKLNSNNQADNNSSISNNNTQQLITQPAITQKNNSEKTMISAAEAQSIAQKYIEEPGATAGTPNLVELNGQMIYVVPVIMNGQTVGQIEIDAYTGKNVGGAGGVA